MTLRDTPDGTVKIRPLQNEPLSFSDTIWAVLIGLLWWEGIIWALGLAAKLGALISSKLT